MNSRITKIARGTASSLLPFALWLTAFGAITTGAQSAEVIKAYVGQNVVLHIQAKPSKDHEWKVNVKKTADSNQMSVKKVGWTMPKGSNFGFYNDKGTLRYVVTPNQTGTMEVTIGLHRKYHSKSPAIKTMTYKIIVSAPDASINTASTPKMPWQE